MKILFVINNAYTKGNGLAASCRRTIQYLREAGEDVRLLSARGPEGESPDYPLPEGRIPFFHTLIKQQGYAFAKCDVAMIRKAVRWADVVHLEEPFELQIKVCKIAEEEKKPLTATYHLHPENFYSTVHLQNSLWFNSMTMLVWRNTVFNHCNIVQCPTENVKERLEKWHFRSELRVISNGIISQNTYAVSPIKKEKGIYLIITTGRFSVEKDQITLLKAMRYSRFASSIQLVLAGRGPTEKRLRKEAEKLLREGVLKHEVVFGFYNLSELQAIYKQADLYIHCAKVEVEGMSCMEAIQTGLVPIIAKGPITATSQFALDEQNLYPAGNSKILAKVIDEWLADDEKRKKEAQRYIGAGEQYGIDKSIVKLRKMFHNETDS